MASPVSGRSNARRSPEPTIHSAIDNEVLGRSSQREGRSRARSQLRIQTPDNGIHGNTSEHFPNSVPFGLGPF